MTELIMSCAEKSVELALGMAKECFTELKGVEEEMQNGRDVLAMGCLRTAKGALELARSHDKIAQHHLRRIQKQDNASDFTDRIVACLTQLSDEEKQTVVPAYTLYKKLFEKLYPGDELNIS